MWEMLTRKQPYLNRNFMDISLHVLEGKRPPVPTNCPHEFEELMTSCWDGKPSKRPSMAEVVQTLDDLLDADGAPLDVSYRHAPGV